MQEALDLKRKFEELGLTGQVQASQKYIQELENLGNTPETLSPNSVWSKDPVTGEDVYMHDKFSFIPEKHIVRRFDGQEVRLTRRESNLLKALAEEPNRVSSDLKLLQNAWGSDYAVANVKWHISSLRRKIESNSKQPEILITLWGKGYYLKDEKRPLRRRDSDLSVAK